MTRQNTCMRVRATQSDIASDSAQNIGLRLALHRLYVSMRRELCHAAASFETYWKMFASTPADMHIETDSWKHCDRHNCIRTKTHEDVHSLSQPHAHTVTLSIQLQKVAIIHTFPANFPCSNCTALLLVDVQLPHADWPVIRHPHACLLPWKVTEKGGKRQIHHLAICYCALWFLWLPESLTGSCRKK